MPGRGESVVRNQAWGTAVPRISVLSPVYRNDPSRLLDSLAREVAASLDLEVELVLVDDGSGDPALVARLEAAVHAFPCAASLIAFVGNQGRSAARNRLMQEARAPYLLFLDSDMLPDRPDFLAAWNQLIDKVTPAIAYGGFSTLQVPDEPGMALARALAERIDCLGARDRMSRGGVAVATSNLLVRADIMKAVPFDDGFSGWGWEDVDWALRAVAAGFAVAHVDIPATHLGLDEPETLLRKFAQAGPNFCHLIDRHPQMLTLPSTHLVRTLASVPGIALMAGPARAVALACSMPLSLRSRAARLWRAIHAATALQNHRRQPQPSA